MSSLRHLFSRQRRRSSSLPVSPDRRRARPRVEELEGRALPSASGLGAAVAQPNLQVTPLAAGGFTYYTPAQVRHAYGFDQVSATGAGQTIAIVDAYDDPNIGGDLARFDAQFGLPAASLTKVRINSPAVNSGWAGEISLDVEWAHAIAPAAKILLVEARSASLTDLLTAVDYARSQPGVVAVSMSWGSNEFTGEAGYDYHFTTPAGHAGITFVASAGDSGAANGPEWPAASPNVLGVGGTSLRLSGSGAYAQETGWADGGGGTSQLEAEPPFQSGVETTGFRDSPDVAYDADPSTGFLVYDSVPNSAGQAGWFVYGGTSAGAPQWAALLALADQGRAQAGLGSLANAQATVYSLPAADFHDVTSGNNGFAATAGYDLVTGLGTPNAPLLLNDLLHAGTVTSSGTQKSTSTTKPTTAHAVTRAGESAGGVAARTTGSATTAAPTLASVGLRLTESAPRPLAPQTATPASVQGAGDAFRVSQQHPLGLSARPADGTYSTPTSGSHDSGHTEWQSGDTDQATEVDTPLDARE
jgi:subtilase family serine protease